MGIGGGDRADTVRSRRTGPANWPQPDAVALNLLARAIAVRCEPEHGIFERAIVDEYAAMMDDFGMEVDVFEKMPNRPNVVGRLRGTGGGKSLLFNGHLNSPSSDESSWKHKPYLMTIDENKIYGSGVADLKAAVVAMLMAARHLADAQPRGDLIIALGAASELAGRIGTKAIIERGVHADMAVVGEPTNLAIVRCQRGALWCRVAVEGKPGLTGSGVNAIHKAVGVIRQLLQLNEQFSSLQHPLLGSGELSVNMIQGGTRISSVPGRCEFTIDRRLIPGETPDEALMQIDALVNRLRLEDAQLQVSLEVALMVMPLCDDGADSVMLREAQSVLAEVLGTEPQVEGIRGFTEMIHLAEAGIDAIVCGPGSAGVVHAPDEYVTLSQFTETIQTYSALARRITCDLA